MSLDTISIPVPHRLVVDYLEKLDQRGEVYSFTASPQTIQRGVDLELDRDGTDDPLSIVLHPDGTWEASHVLVIGEHE